MFVIVRHGNTFAPGELPRRIGARTDLPLTRTGVAQAEALGRHFASDGLQFAQVLVSPLLRTRQTAEAIARHLEPAPAPVSCDWLREIDHGPDENMSEADVLARVGRAALDAWDSRADPPPGWTVDARMRLDAWRSVFAASPEGGTLIVTSNGAARFALLADPALIAASARLASLKLATGSYGTIQRDARGALEIGDWGRRP